MVKNSGYFYFRSPIKSAYKLVLGTHDITDMGVNTNAVRSGVSKIIIHHLYTSTQIYDIAIIKLDVGVFYCSYTSSFSLTN